MFGNRQIPFQGDYNWVALAFDGTTGNLFGYMGWTDNRNVLAGTDIRETDYVDGFDVNQCRTVCGTRARHVPERARARPEHLRPVADTASRLSRIESEGRPPASGRPSRVLKRPSRGRRLGGDRHSKEGTMYARLIEFSGADPDKRDKMLETVRGTVIPMLREYDGYAGYLAMYDAGNSRAKAVLLWETEEAAEEAEKTLVERRKQLAGGIGLTVESQDLYEATVVELEGARV